jgi:hypothetical protein
MLARNYMEEAEKAIHVSLSQIEPIRRAANMIMRTITNGKRVFVTDRYGVVDAEIAEKPGNLALFRSLSHSGEKLAAGDVLIISSFLPDEEKDLAIISEVRALGAVIITVSPEGKLSGSADVAVLDPGANMNGVLSTLGGDRSFGPLSGILHVLLLNMIQAQTAELLIASGKKPTVLPGAYLAGGTKKRTEAMEAFISRGY